MFDVIVIGAGPAGCTAAKILSENGFRVLLTEKFGLPRYKSCSGQLIAKSLELVLRYFGEAVPISVACTPTENRGMVFTDDKGEVFRFEQKGLNVWRSSFDNWLAEKAKQFGAELRDRTSAVSAVEQDGIVSVTLKTGGKTYTEQARYVIDCEGAVGAFKRGLIGERPEGYILTYQTFNDGEISLDRRYFYAFLQPGLSEYDAWFNVKDDQLVLGIAVKDAVMIGEYYPRFIAYMEENHGLKLGKQLRIDRWIMPRISPEFAVEYGIGRVLFAGETAGFLNPMGEGISAALESGYHAAMSVTENFKKPETVCGDYKEHTADLLGYMRRQWSLIGRMTETFKEMR